MKKSWIFCVLLLWIPLLGFSQKDTTGTINLSFTVAKMVALDLLELDRMKEVEALNEKILDKYKLSLGKSQQISASKTLQIYLLKNNLELAEAQINARKEERPKWFNKILIFLGIFAAGFALGSG